MCLIPVDKSINSSVWPRDVRSKTLGFSLPRYPFSKLVRRSASSPALARLGVSLWEHLELMFSEPVTWYFHPLPVVFPCCHSVVMVWFSHLRFLSPLDACAPRHGYFLGWACSLGSLGFAIPRSLSGYIYGVFPVHRLLIGTILHPAATPRHL